MKNFNVLLDEEVRKELRRQSKEKGVLVRRMVEDALRKYLKMEKK